MTLRFLDSTITARGALIYNSSDSNKAVAVYDFGSDQASSSSDFTITFPTADASNAIGELMAFTYAQMKTAIQDYTENTETSFVTNLPVFIRAAEDRIFKLADLEVFRKNATSALTQNDQYLSVPTDYLASFSMSITNSSSKEFLLQKDVNFLHEFHPNASTTGTPKYYAFFDKDNFIVAPTPDSNYSVSFTITTVLHR